MKVALRTKPLKNGSQSIYLDIYENGERRYEYLRLYLVPEVNENAKRSNKNVLAKANEIKNQFVLGKLKFEVKDKSTITLMEWYDEYFRRIKEKPDVSKAVIDHLHLTRPILVDYLTKIKKPHIKLKDFGRKHVIGFLQNMREWKAEKRGKLSSSTMITYQSRFAAMLNAAVCEGYIDQNPIKLLEINEKIVKEESHKEALTMEEVIQFAEVKTNSDTYYNIQQAFLFGCFTGLRLSDIMDLEWSDIKDIGKNGMIIKEQIKTGNLVSVPICDTAARYLPEKAEGQKIFNLPPLTTMRRGLAWIVKASGIEKHVTFHTSRHTFASLTFVANNDLKTVSSLLGHASVETTTIYTDIQLKEKKAAMDKISSLFK